MPSLKALKRRINSVKSTQQIMKAMNLVATSKVQKFKARMEAVRPLFEGATDFLQNGINSDDAIESIFTETRPAKNIAYIVMCGERSLCGSYNANVLKEAMTQLESKTKTGQVIAVGAKCKEFFVRRGKSVVAEHSGVLENISYDVADAIVAELMELYTTDDEEKRVDEVYVVYTQFETLLSHTPKTVKILPFEPSKSSTQKEIIYEPDAETYLRKSVPVYLSMFIYGAMAEASVCEQASRMVSMDAAARNAGDIVEDLTLIYNRQRQSAITQEISEIVGGANAI